MKKSTLAGMLLTVGAFCLTASAAAPLATIAKAAGDYTSVASRADDDDDIIYGYETYENDTYRSLGECTFRDGVLSELLGVPAAVYDVEIEESVEHPGVYRLIEPYKDFRASGYELQPEAGRYMYVDATDPNAVVLHYFFTSVLATATYPDGTQTIEQILIGSMVADYQWRYGRVSGKYSAMDEGKCGTLKHGNITFPAGELLARSIALDDYTPFDPEVQWHQLNSRGEFLITLPDAPLLEGSVNVGQLIDGDNGTYTIPVSATFSSDIDEARVILVKADYAESDAERYYSDLLAGTCEYKSLTYADVRGSKNVLSFDFDGTSAYTAYMVTITDGEEMATFHHTRDLRDENEWRTFDEFAMYSESFLSDNQPIHDPKSHWTGWMEPAVRPVVFEQSLDNPGVIRLVNPYTGEYPTYYEYSREEGAYDYDRYYYMVFDMSYRDRVLLRTTEKGIGLTSVAGLNGKPILVSSKAYRYMTTGGPAWNDITERYEWTLYNEDMVTEAGYWGKYDPETREITFPQYAVQVNFKYNPADAWYEANYNDSFRVTLPESFDYVPPLWSGVENVANDTFNENAPVEYYNMQGVRVANPERGHIYIKRQGSKATKVVL